MKSNHCTLWLAGFWLAVFGLQAAPVRVGVFDVDASPPIGSPLAYVPAKGIDHPLRCTGVVIAGEGRPIVLCALDWIGISNGGYAAFREALAKGAGTEPVRVAVHALHQHDAPRCDFSAQEMLAKAGLKEAGFDAKHARKVIQQTAAATKKALAEAQPVTHLGIGRGIIEKVASNRRILGPDGKVEYIRYTATRNPKIRAFPAGTIDPELKMISFWNGGYAIAALTWYATHPQSYYRVGLATPDFPGIARDARQKATGIPHIHFNGAGGNIGAGKWNDGSHKNRQVLADRVSAGMRLAWKNTHKMPLTSVDVGWDAIPVALPVGKHLDEAKLKATIADEKATPANRYHAAKKLIWLQRCQAKDTIDISCLTLKNARVLHLPGELFVEYQLNAQKLRPDLFVAMAAYGEYAPGYIGTRIAYTQGGYETSARASRVAPEVEEVLMGAIRKLLKAGR